MNTEKLKTIRIGLKMSISELAAKSGVDRNIISEIEKGKANHTIASLDKILKALNANVLFTL